MKIINYFMLAIIVKIIRFFNYLDSAIHHQNFNSLNYLLINLRCNFYQILHHIIL